MNRHKLRFRKVKINENTGSLYLEIENGKEVFGLDNIAAYKIGRVLMNTAGIEGRLDSVYGTCSYPHSIRNDIPFNMPAINGKQGWFYLYPYSTQRLKFEYKRVIAFSPLELLNKNIKRFIELVQRVLKSSKNVKYDIRGYEIAKSLTGECWPFNTGDTRLIVYGVTDFKNVERDSSILRKIEEKAGLYL